MSEGDINFAIEDLKSSGNFEEAAKEALGAGGDTIETGQDAGTWSKESVRDLIESGMFGANVDADQKIDELQQAANDAGYTFEQAAEAMFNPVTEHTDIEKDIEAKLKPDAPNAITREDSTTILDNGKPVQEPRETDPFRKTITPSVVEGGEVYPVNPNPTEELRQRIERDAKTNPLHDMDNRLEQIREEEHLPQSALPQKTASANSPLSDTLANMADENQALLAALSAGFTAPDGVSLAEIPDNTTPAPGIKQHIGDTVPTV